MEDYVIPEVSLFHHPNLPLAASAVAYLYSSAPVGLQGLELINLSHKIEF